MIINMEKTLSAFADDKDIFYSVLEEFVGGFEDQMKELLVCFDAKKVDDLRIFTHTIKGLAATFYSIDLKEVAANAELAAKEGDLETCLGFKEALVVKFEELFNEAKRILNER